MVTHACNSCSGEAKTGDLWGYLASHPCVFVKLQVQRACLNKVDDILKNVLWLLYVHAHTYTCVHAIHMYLNIYTHIYTCKKLKRAISKGLWCNIVSTVTYLCYVQEKRQESR